LSAVISNRRKQKLHAIGSGVPASSLLRPEDTNSCSKPPCRLGHPIICGGGGGHRVYKGKRRDSGVHCPALPLSLSHRCKPWRSGRHRGEATRFRGTPQGTCSLATVQHTRKFGLAFNTPHTTAELTHGHGTTVRMLCPQLYSTLYSSVLSTIFEKYKNIQDPHSVGVTIKRAGASAVWACRGPSFGRIIVF
jgi:hypothetical protein